MAVGPRGGVCSIELRKSKGVLSAVGEQSRNA